MQTHGTGLNASSWKAVVGLLLLWGPIVWRKGGGVHAAGRTGCCIGWIRRPPLKPPPKSCCEQKVIKMNGNVGYLKFFQN